MSELATNHALVLRARAAEAVMAEFHHKPLVWGTHDCGRLAIAAVRALGHRLPLGMIGTWSSEVQAKRALKRCGFGDMADAVDSFGFPRIAPAYRLPGDLVALEGEGGWTALALAVSNARIFGFHGAPPVCRVLKPLQMLTAWRIDPCPR